jgi:dynein heavy chain
LSDTTKELYDIAESFVPIMHTILLIWNHSQNYNTPARLVVLIRQICNAIIKQCRGTIDGPKVFEAIKNEEAVDAHQKLTLALDVCSKFKDAYFDYKGKSKN